MINPLDNIPINTTRVFVMATTLDGCEVYLPTIINFDHPEYDKLTKQKKADLQFYLDKQYIVETDAA